MSEGSREIEEIRSLDKLHFLLYAPQCTEPSRVGLTGRDLLPLARSSVISASEVVSDSLQNPEHP